MPSLPLPTAPAGERRSAKLWRSERPGAAARAKVGAAGSSRAIASWRATGARTNGLDPCLRGRREPQNCAGRLEPAQPGRPTSAPHPNRAPLDKGLADVPSAPRKHESSTSARRRKAAAGDPGGLPPRLAAEAAEADAAAQPAPFISGRVRRKSPGRRHAALERAAPVQGGGGQAEGRARRAGGDAAHRARGQLESAARLHAEPARGDEGASAHGAARAPAAAAAHAHRRAARPRRPPRRRRAPAIERSPRRQRERDEYKSQAEREAALCAA